jgi:hypothetical protein
MEAGTSVASGGPKGTLGPAAEQNKGVSTLKRNHVFFNFKFLINGVGKKLKNGNI